MKYNGIIFDFNGVLLFDRHLHEEAWNTFSKKYRGREFSEDEIHNHLHGRANSHIISYLLDKSVEGNELLDYVEEKESMYRDMCLSDRDSFVISPGGVELLDFLKANNIPRAIATASEINNLKFFFKHLDLAHWFDFEKCVWDSGFIRGKPHPDKFIIAAYNIGVHPNAAVVVEDSISGIKSAHAADIGWIYGLGEIDSPGIKDIEGLSGVISNLTEFDTSIFNLSK